MEINRKRVARRLASGLVAGALALGGLAISGGSVSAKTPSSPTTNRIAGDDRYETAVELARLATNANDGLVVVSGESPWDALSASTLTTATRPMVLVRANSVPESVLDFISDSKAGMIGQNAKIYVVGGTSAVSDDTADAILAAAKTAGDTSAPKIVRVSGDDRYATSKAVAALASVTSASDKMILVNGNSWADAVSASTMAAQNGWPLVLTPGSAQGSAKDAIDAYIALPGSVAQFVIVGGPAVMPTAIDEYLVGEGVAPADIVRIGGADRYGTSLLVNVWLYNYDGDFDGEYIALASGAAPWDALTAASWAALKGGAVGNRVHLQLTSPQGANASSATLGATMASLGTAGLTAKGGTLYIIGGKNAVSDSAKAAFVGSMANDLTTTLICPAEGSSNLTLVYSGALTAGAGSEQSKVTLANLGPKIKLNGTAIGTGAGAITPVKINASTYLLVLGTAAAEDDEYKLAADVEGSNFVMNARSAAGSSCVVADDSTEPSVSLRAIAGAAGDGTTAGDMHFILSSNEPLDLSNLAAGDLKIGSTASAAAPVATKLDAAGTTYMLTLAASGETALTNALTANTVVTVLAANVKDLAGNAVVADLTATAAADSKAPTISVSSASCVAKAGGLATMNRGSLTVTAKSTSALGAAGNDYTLVVVNQRGLLIPTVAIAEKVITVTADTGYHTVEDVMNAAKNSYVEDALLGGWVFTNTGTAGDLVTATVIPAVSTAGTSTCTLTVVGTEAFTQNSAAITIDGYSSVVSSITDAVAVSAAGPLVAAAADGVSKLRTSHTITFDTTRLGAGLLTFASSGATAAQDAKNNIVLSGSTFTAA